MAVEGDEHAPEQDVSVQDEDWPYDPTWVELAAPPLEQVRRAVVVDQLRNLIRYPAAPTNRPPIAP